MSEIIAKTKEIILPVVESLGYETVDVTYTKQYGENNLTVFIWKKDGISLEDCELVNNALDEVLENGDISDGVPYIFNVSSPGLDRPIVSDDDYRRNLEEEIEVLFQVPVGKTKRATGKLLSYDAKTVEMEVKTKKTVFERTNISLARPYIKFK